MSANQQGQRGGGKAQAKGSAATRTKNRRAFAIIIYFLGLLTIYSFDKLTLDTQIVDYANWLDEDGDGLFNPGMVEGILQTLLVGGFAALTWMGVKTAKDEEV